MTTGSSKKRTIVNLYGTRIVPTVLAGGNIMHDVRIECVGGLPGTAIVFACVDETHAKQLLALIDKCVDVYAGIGGA